MIFRLFLQGFNSRKVSNRCKKICFKLIEREKYSRNVFFSTCFFFFLFRKLIHAKISTPKVRRAFSKLNCLLLLSIRHSIALQVKLLLYIKILPFLRTCKRKLKLLICGLSRSYYITFIVSGKWNTRMQHKRNIEIW